MDHSLLERLLDDPNGYSDVEYEEAEIQPQPPQPLALQPQHQGLVLAWDSGMLCFNLRTSSWSQPINLPVPGERAAKWFSDSRNIHCLCGGQWFSYWPEQAQVVPRGQRNKKRRMVFSISQLGSGFLLQHEIVTLIRAGFNIYRIRRLDHLQLRSKLGLASQYRLAAVTRYGPCLFVILRNQQTGEAALWRGGLQGGWDSIHDLVWSRVRNCPVTICPQHKLVLKSLDHSDPKLLPTDVMERPPMGHKPWNGNELVIWSAQDLASMEHRVQYWLEQRYIW